MCRAGYLGTKSGALTVALPPLLLGTLALPTLLGTPEKETPLEPATCPAITGFHWPAECVGPAVGGRVLGRVGPAAPWIAPPTPGM